jgi:hypothetical protein
MKLKEFGFNCGTFSVALSGNGYVIPGCKRKPFGPQMIPIRDINDAAGLYHLGVTAEGRTICDALVHVVWVSAAAEQGPFLAFKCDDDTVLPALRAQQGKAVQLKFTLSGDGNPAATGPVQ